MAKAFGRSWIKMSKNSNLKGIDIAKSASCYEEAKETPRRPLFLYIHNEKHVSKSPNIIAIIYNLTRATF